MIPCRVCNSFSNTNVCCSSSTRIQDQRLSRRWWPKMLTKYRFSRRTETLICTRSRCWELNTHTPVTWSTWCLSLQKTTSRRSSSSVWKILMSKRSTGNTTRTRMSWCWMFPRRLVTALMTMPTPFSRIFSVFLLYAARLNVAESWRRREDRKERRRELSEDRRMRN